MDNNIQPNKSLKEFNSLGYKTLFIFILKRIWVIVLLSLIGAAVWIFAAYIPTDYILAANLGMVVLFVIWMLTIMFTLLFAWLEYLHYHISLSDDDINISRGLIAEEEIGIPFRRIKEVKFERSLMDQMMGVSNVILMILGEEGDGSSKESRVTLPSLDTRIAKQIQNIVLNKAEVEEVNMNSGKPAK